jgi:transcriptional regulator with XRE-family HTH domain
VDESAGLPVGERIQTIRTRRGLTRPVVAGLVGRSADWLKKVEKGQLGVPRLEMLVRLAEVLGLDDVTELTGGQQGGMTLSSTRREGHHAVPAVREAIEDAMLSVPAEPYPDAAELEQRVHRAWLLWHSSTTRVRTSAGSCRS